MWKMYISISTSWSTCSTNSSLTVFINITVKTSKNHLNIIKGSRELNFFQNIYWCVTKVYVSATCGQLFRNPSLYNRSTTALDFTPVTNYSSWPPVCTISCSWSHFYDTPLGFNIPVVMSNNWPDYHWSLFDLYYGDVGFIMAIPDSHMASDYFIKTFHSIADIYAPFKKFRVKNRNYSWFCS